MVEDVTHSSSFHRRYYVLQRFSPRSEEEIHTKVQRQLISWQQKDFVN